MSYPLTAPIYTPSDKYGVREREEGIAKARAIYDSFESEYKWKLELIRELCQGYETCVIIGNGPSLNDTDLSFIETTPSFGANSIFLKYDQLDFFPAFYVVEDHLVAEDRAATINQLNKSIHLFPTYLGYCLDENANTVFYRHLPRKSYPDGFDFSEDASTNTFTGCTVTFSSLQLAYFFGFTRILLVGVDHSYKIPVDTSVNSSYGVGVLDMESDDPNHFDPSYFGKGLRWHDPQSDKMEEAYRCGKAFLDKKGVEVINCTIGGKLEVFPRKSLEEALRGANEKAPGPPVRLLEAFLHRTRQSS